MHRLTVPGYAFAVVDRRIKFRAPGSIGSLEKMLHELETEFRLPQRFSERALAAAEDSLKTLTPAPSDHTGLPFFTLDPPTSTDLDQAMYLERREENYRVYYAIADVPALVPLGSLLDEVTRQRGQTFYLPHRRIGLHPASISEDGGSLLPGVTRRAFVWILDLDASGALTGVSLERSQIRSRAKLDYPGAQRALDAGTADTQLELLRTIGTLRIGQEQLRQGASLNLPDQEVTQDAAGNYRLLSRLALPIEDYNAQISLLTGMAAAQLMIDAGVGILRTMPQPGPKELAEFRAHADSLGHHWDAGLSYGEFLRTLDISKPAELVLMHRAAALFRGADYSVINGQRPEEMLQAALAAPYTHATAPLRRLVDRFVLLTCQLIVTGQEIPPALHEALEALPQLMRTSSAEASRATKASIDLIEAWILQHRVGEEFQAVVLRAASAPTDTSAARPGSLQLLTEAVTGSFHGPAQPAALIRVRLVRADPVTRSCEFEQVTVQSASQTTGS